MAFFSVLRIILFRGVHRHSADEISNLVLVLLRKLLLEFMSVLVLKDVALKPYLLVFLLFQKCELVPLIYTEHISITALILF